MKRGAAFGVTSILLLSAIPLFPTVEAAPTVFASHDDVTSGWWATNFTLSSTTAVTARVTTSFNNPGPSQDLGAGLWIRKSTGGLDFAFPLIAYSTRSFTHVQSANDLSPVSVHTEHSSPAVSIAPFTHQATVVLPAGDYTFVGVAVSPGLRTARYELVSEASPTVGAAANASSARLWREWQFNATLAVGVERHQDHFIGTIGPSIFIHDAHSVRTIVNASVAYHVDHKLFGGILGVGEVVDVGFSGPSTTRTAAAGFVTARCIAFDGADAGDWAFRIRRYVGAGKDVFSPTLFDCGPVDIALAPSASNALTAFAADVELP